MDFEVGKARIMDALLKHEGLAHLVDVGADVLGNPVFVCDLAAQVMAMSHGSGADRKFWDEFFPGGRMDPENALNVGRAGVYERVFSGDKPVVGKFDFFPGRFVGARIRLRDEVIGMATLVERRPLGACDSALLVVLCQAIVLELTWQDTQGQASLALTDVINAAIEGASTGSELDLLARGARLTLPQRSRVLVIALGLEHSGVLFSFLQGRLKDTLPTSPMVMRHGRLVVLLDLGLHEEVPVGDIVSCFANIPLRIGAERPFGTLEGIGASYRQARAAMEISSKAGHPAVLADYEGWHIDDLLARAAAWASTWTTAPTGSSATCA